MRDCRALWARTLAIVVLLASRGLAQSAFPLMDDATAPPKGVFRFKSAALWTRFDARFTANGTLPLGGQFSADSLGVSQFPSLATTQTGIETASGSAFVLSLGRSRVNAVAREEVVPISLEYGISKRLSVGVMMPVVRRRVFVQVGLDTAGGYVATVGTNPNRLSGSSAGTTNAQVQIQFASAISQLQNRLTSCQGNPSGPGCPALLAREAEAQQLIASAQGFASDVASVYGTQSTLGSFFVPLASSDAQTAINARVSAFNTQFQDFLGTTANLLTQTPVGSAGPAGHDDLQRYLTDELGRDSIVNTERVLVGDVEIGAKFGALDMRRPGFRAQLALAGGVRLATGSRQSKGELFALNTGGGMIVASGSGLFDARAGRVGVFASASYAANVRAVDTVNLASRAERWTDVSVAPRWHLSDGFSLHGAYVLRSTDKEGGDQLAGGGFTISRISDFTGGPLPIEMRFTHLEAIRGDPDRPKFFRDQLEMRIYYRLRR